MRLLLVGPFDERQRLRAEIEDAAFTIAGEFATLADARASGIDADAILIADVARALTARQLDGEIEEPLTPREVEVVELLAEGLSNKAIAARLGISDQTVKFHVASISGKLGAANRTDAVRRAVRRGLISL
jgi:DNA-binding NarL/FixJ family response regulator